MKISCPKCNASGTIRDHDIPESGRIITCPRCQERFPVTTLRDGNDTVAAKNGTQEITATLLGLDELDAFPREIPDVFIGLKDSGPVDEHRQVVARALPEMTVDLQDRLVSFLTAMSGQVASETVAPETAIILLTQDELLSHAVTTVSKRGNSLIFVTDKENGLDTVIQQSLGKDQHPILVIDVPHDNDCPKTLSLVRKKAYAYPQIPIHIAACCHTWLAISTDVLGAGVDSILPRPCRICHEDLYVTRLIAFLSGSGALNLDRSLFSIPV